MSVHTQIQHRLNDGGILYEPAGGREGMRDAPELVLAHHLKTLRLPTLLREHDNQAPFNSAIDTSFMVTKAQQRPLWLRRPNSQFFSIWGHL
ncbi:hypothetical protein SAMN04488512_101357 [Sulfitobacter litoralis]|mgnify:FL=1|uniref:Uncharacterized protein n=1 Tax=Sulfitobacter litoralis TaxID=335975 RepID=A0ABY0RKQ6_9RHOB|nr:hypothetical protein SAMN04488512_101357 [Sulfitobacter litoralis]